MNILMTELNEKELKLKNRIFHIMSYGSDNDEVEKLSISAVKTFGLAINEFPDFSLKVFIFLFDCGDRQMEFMPSGLGGRRSILNAANYLTKKGFCYWDLADVSNVHFGHELCVDRSKYISSDFIR